MASLRDRLAKKRKDLESSSQGYKFFRITEGTTRYRIRNTGEEKDWAIEVTVFYLGKDLGYVISPISFGGKCAIMKAYNELAASKKESDRAVAKNFKPNKKFMAGAGKYKDEKGKEPDYESGTKPLMLAGGQYQDMIDLFLDDDEAGNFTDAESGYDLKMGRTGKTKTDTEYTVRACKPTPAPKKWRKEIDLTAMVKGITPSYPDTKDLIEKFLSLPPDEDEDDRPKKKKKKKSRDL